MATHPTVFEQYNLPHNASDTFTNPDQLIALVILFLHHEKNMQTVEGERIHRQQSLPKFKTEWSTNPWGDDDMMLNSLNYQKLSLPHTPNYPRMYSGKVDEIVHVRPQTISSAAKNGKQRKMIEEIRPEPRWQLNREQELRRTVYTIELPRGTKVEDCQLDISRV